MRYKLFPEHVGMQGGVVEMCKHNIIYHDGFAWVFPYNIFWMGVLWFRSRLACFVWIHKFINAANVYLAI